jgi:hypothetical protein
VESVVVQPLLEGAAPEVGPMNLASDPWGEPNDDHYTVTSLLPPEFSDHDYVPTYYPEEDEDADSGWARPRSPLRQHTCQPDTYGGVSQIVFERMLRDLLGLSRGAMDDYAKVWEQAQREQADADRRVREAEAARRAILQERRAEQMTRHTERLIEDKRFDRERLVPKEEDIEDWDFLPDHPFEEYR